MVSFSNENYEPTIFCNSFHQAGMAEYSAYFSTKELKCCMCIIIVRTISGICEIFGKKSSIYKKNRPELSFFRQFRAIFQPSKYE